MSTYSFSTADSQLHRAWRDLGELFTSMPLWGTLGIEDIRQRYRRSALGPLWITMSMGIMVVALGYLYSNLFALPAAEFIPYLAVSLIVWGFISGCMNEGCATFIQYEGILKNTRLPQLMHPARLVWRQTIVMAHNLIIWLAVLLWFGIAPTTQTLLVLPAYALYAVTGFCIALILGMLSARYRDIPPIVQNFVQVIFFFSPIVWKPSTLPADHPAVIYNPFTYILDVMRAPLLGQAPMDASWAVMMGVTVFFLFVASALYVKKRRQLAYWL